MHLLSDHPDTAYQGSFESVQQNVGGVYKRFGNCALLRVEGEDENQNVIKLYEWDPTTQPDDPQTKFAKKKIISLINGSTHAFLSAAEVKKKMDAKGMLI